MVASSQTWPFIPLKGLIPASFGPGDNPSSSVPSIYRWGMVFLAAVVLEDILGSNVLVAGSCSRFLYLVFSGGP